MSEKNYKQLIELAETSTVRELTLLSERSGGLSSLGILKAIDSVAQCASRGKTSCSSNLGVAESATVPSRQAKYLSLPLLVKLPGPIFNKDRAWAFHQISAPSSPVFCRLSVEFTMPAPNHLTPTLQKLLDHIKDHPQLPANMKTEIGSAVRRFAEITGKHPADIIADPVVVRLLADKASWQLAGLSKESWANLEKQAHPRDEDRRHQG
ncbi:hypothetical protein [Hyphomicrobium sp. ghe19]|uniref:hypothetical protein n=1 Tax=Hyphomicrobium sp. ghe19 TaxID=2682968 RepID=UPI0030D483F0